MFSLGRKWKINPPAVTGTIEWHIHVDQLICIILKTEDYNSQSWMSKTDRKICPKDGYFIWHHKACQRMTKGDPEGQIFLSTNQTNDP